MDRRKRPRSNLLWTLRAVVQGKISRDVEGRPPATMRILLPLDGSRLSEEAMSAVQRLSSQGISCSVEIMQVLDPMAAIGTMHLRISKGRMSEYVREQAKALREHGIPATSHVDVGPPARQIIQRLADGGFDYVCMATHGRSGLARATLGSVTDQVIRESPVPVLVVHPQPSISQEAPWPARPASS